MQVAGTASRCTVPGCAPFSRPRFKFHSVLGEALAAAAMICAAAPVMAADSAASSSRGSVGMIYVDAALAPTGRAGNRNASSGQADHPIYRELSAGLEAYQQTWGLLPQIEIVDGPLLRPGTTGDRVRQLRERLGLAPVGAYDSELQEKVRSYQTAHGLPADGVAGGRTIESLNRGAAHYEGLVRANLARVRAIPVPATGRYLLVDAAAAQLWMYEDGQPVDSMRVIVGKPSEQTPMLAAYVRYAVVNPYWNVPPDLVQRRIAANVLDQGTSYLRERRYEVLSGWSVNAEVLDPATIDWREVAAGRREVRVRQLPGEGNMMGDVKFMMSDELGIYLHDTPDRGLFDASERQLSSGCVRLEDAGRLSQWLLGRASPGRSDAAEQRVDLPEPVPVFITYLTAAPSDRGLVFRQDVYGRDAAVLASLAP